MHQLGPILTSLTLDEARRALLAKSYTLVTQAYYSYLQVFIKALQIHRTAQQSMHRAPHVPA
jgi:hypothetical protein